MGLGGRTYGRLQKNIHIRAVSVKGSARMFCLDKILFESRLEVLKRKQKGCFCYACLSRKVFVKGA